MAVVKKTERGLCPFNQLKKCNKKCSLFRSGFRYKQNDPNTPIPFEDCAINIIADNAEVSHHRIFALQKEFGELKNISAFATLVSLGMEDPGNLGRIAKSFLDLPSETKKMIEDKDND